MTSTSDSSGLKATEPKPLPVPRIANDPWGLCKNGDLAGLDSFLQDHQDFDVNENDSVGTSCICWAAKYGHKPIVERLIEHGGVDINKKGFGGFTPLHLAVNNIRQDILKILIDNGSDVNAVDDNGSEPLHYACSKGVLGQVDFLLENGAKPDAKNKYGILPIHRALFEGHLGIIQRLVKCDGVNIAENAMPDGKSALELAQDLDFPEIVSFIESN